MSIPPEWRTHAENTDYRETPSYDDTVAYARRLAHASLSIDYRGFGYSGQGRELPLIVASETGTFTPEAVQAQGKAVVYWKITHMTIASGATVPSTKESAF